MEHLSLDLNMPRKWDNCSVFGTKLNGYFDNTAAFARLQFCSYLFSGLSLVLKKEGLWLTKMDTQPERTLRWATHRRQELIHTSCRSESSNISLVVLDKDPISPLCVSIFDPTLNTHAKAQSDRSMAIKKSKFGHGVAVRNLTWNLNPALLKLHLACPTHKHVKREVPPPPVTSGAIWTLILELSPPHPASHEWCHLNVDSGTIPAQPRHCSPQGVLKMLFDNIWLTLTVVSFSFPQKCKIFPNCFTCYCKYNILL